MPLVAVPLRVDGTPGRPSRLYQNRVYFDAIEDAGGAVLPVPLVSSEERLRALYDRCDAVLLPGGPDVEPQLYGETVREDCDVHTNPEQDFVDLALARWALTDGKPLLAICRGMQVLNVALGGTLWQDLGRQLEGTLEHRHEPRQEVVHDIETVVGSRLRDVVGAERIPVNSLHHQGLRDVAPSLAVSARTSDGLVEGVEHTEHPFAVGVQCHPEELYGMHPWASRLFGELVASAQTQS